MLHNLIEEILQSCQLISLFVIFLSQKLPQMFPFSDSLLNFWAPLAQQPGTNKHIIKVKKNLVRVFLTRQLQPVGLPRPVFSPLFHEQLGWPLAALQTISGSHIVLVVVKRERRSNTFQFKFSERDGRLGLEDFLIFFFNLTILWYVFVPGLWCNSIRDQIKGIV